MMRVKIGGTWHDLDEATPLMIEFENEAELFSLATGLLQVPEGRLRFATFHKTYEAALTREQILAWMNDGARHHREDLGVIPDLPSGELLLQASILQLPSLEDEEPEGHG